MGWLWCRGASHTFGGGTPSRLPPMAPAGNALPPNRRERTVDEIPRRASTSLSMGRNRRSSPMVACHGAYRAIRGIPTIHQDTSLCTDGSPSVENHEDFIRHFNVECHPTKYHHGWFDWIGWYLAMGDSFDTIRARTIKDLPRISLLPTGTRGRSLSVIRDTMVCVSTDTEASK